MPSWFPSILVPGQFARKYLASVHDVIWEHIVRPSHLENGAGRGAVPGCVDSFGAANFFRRSAFSSSAVGGLLTSFDGQGLCWYWTEPLVWHLYIGVAANTDEEGSNMASVMYANLSIEVIVFSCEKVAQCIHCHWLASPQKRIHHRHPPKPLPMLKIL